MPINKKLNFKSIKFFRPTEEQRYIGGQRQRLGTEASGGDIAQPAHTFRGELYDHG